MEAPVCSVQASTGPPSGQCWQVWTYQALKYEDVRHSFECCAMIKYVMSMFLTSAKCGCSVVVWVYCVCSSGFSFLNYDLLKKYIG